MEKVVPKIAAPRGKPYRVSSDAVWPLRGADGLTYAERRQRALDQIP